MKIPLPLLQNAPGPPVFIPSAGKMAFRAPELLRALPTPRIPKELAPEPRIDAADGSV